MATEQIDKLGQSQAPKVPDTPRRRGRARVRGKVWPMDTGASDDTFATPSEANAGEIDADSFAGSEPAVFGGLNPSTDEQAPAAEPVSEPLGTALDQSVGGNDLLPDAPKINFGRLVRSTSFLLGGMVAILIGSTMFIRMAVPTETYVQTSVKFTNYGKLNEIEVHDLQNEMNTVLRTYPLRQQAWDLLQKRSPGVNPGFLLSGLTFHRLDAITWDNLGVLRLRVESNDPGDDITRLSAISDSFYNFLQGRQTKLVDYKAELDAQSKRRDQQLARDAELRLKIDDLLPDAQHYLELKQAMQGIERYLELSDESNPLRFVARQNLLRLSGQVGDARLLSLQRDDLVSERMVVQKKSDAVAEEITRLDRVIEVFAYPEPPDPSALLIYDTRGHQTWILRAAWVVIVALFGGLAAYLNITDHFAKDRHRRSRRDLLQRKKGDTPASAAESLAPSAPPPPVVPTVPTVPSIPVEP